MYKEEKKDANQSSKFPPNSIGGMLDEKIRQKLININADGKNLEKTDKENKTTKK